MSAGKYLAGLAFAFSSGLAFAQAPSYGPSDVTLDQAKKMAANSVAHAQKSKWPVAIAIVDRHGFLVYFERLDDTQTGSIDVAIDKAKAAAMFRRPSRAFEEGIAKGRNALLGLRGATPITGGVPIVVGGKIIGGVGVSGASADQDEEVALAGAKSL
jgi:uncharacterized protein GlcG (DUF336 family)